MMISFAGGAAACRHHREPEPPTASTYTREPDGSAATDDHAGQPIPTSSVRSARGTMYVDLIFRERLEHAPDELIASIAASPAYLFTRVTTPGESAGTQHGLAIRTRLDEPYPGATLNLPRALHGISDDDREQIRTARSNTSLAFMYETPFGFTNLHLAAQLTFALAVRFDAFIYDSVSRDYFTPAAWREERVLPLESYPLAGAGSSASIFSVHKGAHTRLATHGMVVFGMPDVIAADTPDALHASMQLVLRTIIDSMVHSPSNADEGVIVVNLPDPPGSTPRLPINVHMSIANRKWHDAPNRLMAIDFSSESGNTLAERQRALISRFGFATPPSVPTNAAVAPQPVAP